MQMGAIDFVVRHAILRAQNFCVKYVDFLNLQFLYFIS